MVAAAVVLVTATGAWGQPGFRLTWTVGPTEAGQTRVAGVLYNISHTDVVDVYVTAEALDAAGRVVASGISYVAGLVPERGSAPFVAKVPVVAGTTAYRVRVSAFRQGFGSQS